MPTLHQHRLIGIVPTAKASVVGTWWATNVDADEDYTKWPPLNATGLPADPVTHNWFNTALTDPQCKAVLTKLCQLSGVTPPTNAQWNGWTKQQKRAWLLSVQAAIITGYGLLVTLADNTGTWDNPANALTLMGLKVIQAPMP